MEELTRNIQAYVDLMGALSIVTKLGRKATKCKIRIFGALPGTPPPTITSLAWSYDQERPIKSTIKVNVYANPQDADEDTASTDSIIKGAISKSVRML